MSAQSRISRSLRHAAPSGPRVVASLAALAIAAPIAPAWATGDTTSSTASSVANTSAPLPFDLPSSSELRASSRKAFAHYVPWFPASIDNKAPDYYDRNFLVPDGEGGKHAAYGGYLRDRPASRPVIADTAWRLRDLETEVRQAVAAGLDGFVVDILQLGDTGGTQWTAIQQLQRAAQSVDPGFKIMMMPDMTGTNMGAKDAPTLAKYMAQLADSPSTYRLADGRLVVSPFTAERKTVAFWTEFLSIMKNTYGETVAFLPLFQDERKWRTTFAPISYGMTNWGNRNPAWNDPAATGADSPRGRAAAVKALGKAWMQPVSVQDERPREGIFDEAQNTQNLRNTWKIARDSGADLVQIPTWNDYAEGSQIAPSGQNGPAWLDMTSYYLSWYKTGTAPEIVRDAVYLTHRGQPHASLPSYAQTLLMKRRGTSSSPARDTVEALTFLTAPGTVRITVGATTSTCEVDAGVDTCTVPLAPGDVKAVVERAGSPVTTVTSPRKVTSRPYVQDLQYVAATSGRQAQQLTDSTAPSVPSGVEASSSGNSVTVSWSPSTDDRAVTGYDVHRSDTSGFTPSAATLVGSSTTGSFSQPAAVGTWYYRVVAKDAAGNMSAASPTTSATVLDTQAPSVPASLSATASGSSISLAWAASTDDVAVTAYEVHRSSATGFTPSAATLVGSTTTGSFSQLVATGTWYYRVVATDAAGNSSAASTQAQIAVAPVAPVATVTAPTTVLTVRPSADTYANEGAKTKNFGTSSSLSSRGSLGAVSYLRYSIPAAPAGKTLRSAVLNIRTTTESFAGSTDTHAVKSASGTWTGLTWATKPAVSSTVLGTIAAGTVPNTVYSTPLNTAALQSFAASTRTFAVTSTGTDHLWFWSANHAATAYAPRLVLTYN